MTLEKYKKINYYARAIAIGIILWIALMIVLVTYWLEMARIVGDIGAIISAAILFVVCLTIGYYLNKLTWKYMLINKL
jgi:hypothetical protein